MKRILASFLLGLTIVGCVLAADLVQPVKLTVSNVYTNGGGSKTFTYPYKVSGEVVGIVLDVAGYATPTVQVTVATSTNGTMGVAQTLFYSAAITNTTDAVYPVTDIICTAAGVDISNVPAPIRLWEDYLYCTVTNIATNATTDVTAWVFLKR